jgi:hypothetical protein
MWSTANGRKKLRSRQKPRMIKKVAHEKKTTEASGLVQEEFMIARQLGSGPHWPFIQ